MLNREGFAGEVDSNKGLNAMVISCIKGDYDGVTEAMGHETLNGKGWHYAL
jgi:hypothetical protein